jgi:hypothetical protein
LANCTGAYSSAGDERPKLTNPTRPWLPGHYRVVEAEDKSSVTSSVVDLIDTLCAALDGDIDSDE